MRIGISGSAGVGKTSLARALSAALGLPLVGEEMRAHLEVSGRRLESLSRPARRAVLEQLWDERRRTVAAHRGFVADNSCIDFAVYALHQGLIDGDDDPLLREPIKAASDYDAVIVLPHGALPYARDGVRSDDPNAELRFQRTLEDLLNRHMRPEQLFEIPTFLNDSAGRLRACTDHLAEDRPLLSGRSLLVGRARPGPSKVAVGLVELGAWVHQWPQLEAFPPNDPAPLEEALHHLDSYETLIFGCASSVEAVFKKRESRHGGQRIVAIGRDAARALTARDRTYDRVTPGACAQALASLADEVAPCALFLQEGGRPVLERELQNLALDPDIVPCYRLEPSLPATLPKLDGLVLPASSAARLLLASPHGATLRELPTVVIGEHTETEATRLGAKTLFRSDDDTVGSLVARAAEIYGAAGQVRA